MLVNSILPVLALLASVSAGVSTKSLVTCRTKQGPTSTSPIKTTSNVLTIPFYAFKSTTSTPSTTVTPATSTTTISTTTTIRSTTTLPVETDTLTSTSTITSTSTSTVLTTTTSFTTSSTTVFTTDTTTIAAPAGFIPVETSLPNSMKRRAIDAPAQEELDHALDAKRAAGSTKIYAKNGKPACDPAIYPQSVNCVGLVAVISTITRTNVAKTTRTITAPTPIVTTTTSFTTSTTITSTPAHASTTTTVTTTTTTTTTTTSTSTTPSTVVDVATVAAPQATFYAACADNNIVSTVNGKGIISGNVDGTAQQNIVSSTSAYDCCVTCLNTANCAVAAYFNDGQFCDLISETGSTCSQNNQVLSVNTGSYSSFVVSNGLCGVAYPGISG